MAAASSFAAMLFLFADDLSVVLAQEGHFCTGLDVDWVADDWVSCSSSESTLSLRQVGRPDSGLLTDSLRARFAYDDTHVYVLAQLRAGYYFNLTGRNSLSHSFSVMWKVGRMLWYSTWADASSPLRQPTPQVRTLVEHSIPIVETTRRCATVMLTW